MARKTEEREIGAHRYRVKQFKVRQAHAVMTRIAKVTGGGLGEIANGLGEQEATKALTGDLSKDGVGAAITRLTQDLGEDDLDWLVDRIRPCVEMETTTDGMYAMITAEHWDDHFAGDNLFDEMKLIAFTLELNFAGFFAGLGGAKSALAQLVTPSEQSKSSPRKTATAGSGA